MPVLTLHPTQVVAAPADLWHAYERTADARVRDRLVFTLAPLVRQAGAETADEAACGLQALVDAVDAYAPERDGPLESFAWRRVRAALASSR
jgi:DNA-directed RNA polymerase specialized sigma subunit